MLYRLKQHEAYLHGFLSAPAHGGGRALQLHLPDKASSHPSLLLGLRATAVHPGGDQCLGTQCFQNGDCS